MVNEFLLCFQPGKEHLEKHYADLSKKGFFNDLVAYMNSGPVVAMASSISLMKKYIIWHQRYDTYSTGFK